MSRARRLRKKWKRLSDGKDWVFFINPKYLEFVTGQPIEIAKTDTGESVTATVRRRRGIFYTVPK